MSFPFDYDYLPVILAAAEMGDLDLPECMSPEQSFEDENEDEDEDDDGS